MTVTYNGSKITTDVLYENGTIQIKKGFSRLDIKCPRIDRPSIVSAKSKTKIFSKFPETEVTVSLIKYPNINSAKSKTKIWQKTVTDSDAEVMKIDVPIIISCRTKVVIVTP